MKKISHKAFTLIELMVVITIMLIMTLAAYAPYQLYQTKQKVRNSVKIVTQSLYEARNMAINWTSSWSYNVDIWVLFEHDASEVVYYQREYSDDNSKNYNELKRVQLAQWVEITKVNWWASWFFWFDSVSWSWTYFENVPLPAVVNTTISSDKINIQMWFKWAETWLLTWEVDYYTKTYVADPK